MLTYSPLAAVEGEPGASLSYGVCVGGEIHAFPHYWQVPAATEMTAFEALSAKKGALDFDYFGYPWATIIDGVRSRSFKAWDILGALAETAETLPLVPVRRRVTVAQHIHALEFAEVFNAIGITDVFWSHATTETTEHDGMRIHPFPLFPAQAPTTLDRVTADHPRQFLANFIGAYNSKIYLSNVRELIFEDAGKHGDLLIVARKAWHFDRFVYEEQVRGVRPGEAQRLEETRKTQEYLDAIRASWFTLCPTGSGPNSIRIFESLALGSIPIILTKTLRLPGASFFWRKAAIVEDDSDAGYRRAIERARATTEIERLKMLKFGAELFEEVGPKGYGELILSKLQLRNV